MIDKIIKLSKELIEFPSAVTDLDAKVDVLMFVEKQLAGHKFIPFASNGLPSLLYTNQDKDKKHFKILMNGHLDVVPGKNKQYKPHVKDGKLYGRGAYDMKAATATMILVFKEIANKVPYPLGLQLVTDEEIGGENGTKYQIQKNITADFVIGGECSCNLTINNEAKGVLVIKIRTGGKSAHSAYPWRGENASLKMVQIIHKIHDLFPLPSKESWTTTASVIKIETENDTVNTIPDNCAATISIRYTPEDKRNLIQVIKDSLPVPAEIEIMFEVPPEYTSPTNPYVKKLKDSIKHTTKTAAVFKKTHAQSDLRYYHMEKIPAVNFGPIGHGQHADDEWVDIKSLEQYYEILKQFLLSVK